MVALECAFTVTILKEKYHETGCSYIDRFLRLCCRLGRRMHVVTIGPAHLKQRQRQQRQCVYAEEGRGETVRIPLRVPQLVVVHGWDLLRSSLLIRPAAVRLS